MVEHPQAPVTNHLLELPVSGEFKEEIIRARKIRIYRTTSQKESLEKWFGCQRFMYDRALKLHRDGMEMSVKALRQTLLNRDTDVLEPQEEWLSEYNNDLKSEALRDIVK